MLNRLEKYKFVILLWVFILTYIIYFSYFTILRYRALYASYYDLGIMHQTVFNSYQAIKTWDWSRFLELTSPTGTEQIKRMAIHNDVLLALLAPFYFIHSGPETLLVTQSVFSGLGALAVFKIANIILRKFKEVNLLSLLFSLAYLLYPPLELANIYDFHAVVLSTSLLLFMFYFWLIKKYLISIIFLILSLISKEQVGLTTLFFGLFVYTTILRRTVVKKERRDSLVYAGVASFLSVIWFTFSMFYLIPLFRGGQHFAVERYADFGDSPIRIIIGVLTNPYSISKYIFRLDTLRYMYLLLGPTGFLSLLSPAQLFIALPELAINLLSKSSNMRNIIYQYTAVITPFVFISAIYGMKRLIGLVENLMGSLAPNTPRLGMTKKVAQVVCLFFLSFFMLYFAYFKGPLPFSKAKNIHPLRYPQKEAQDAAFWSKTLQDEKLKISTTGQLSPFFTSRRYFYTFSSNYYLADYVVVRLNEIYNYPEKGELIPVYERLIKDSNYELIYQRENFEVYKKVKS